MHPRCRVRSVNVKRVEFTIEPFVEGQLGSHVSEPIAAVRALGVDLEVGPFGTGCSVDDHLSADGNGRYFLGYGIFNLGPCPLPGGKVIFTSSRNMFQPNKSFTAPTHQLFVMDNDGANVELVGHLNLRSALHPSVLNHGRVLLSSYEAQGLRDRRIWGLWAIWPDGRRWEPMMSAFTAPNAFHFQSQLTNVDVALVEYYTLNNNGFGTVLGFPANRPPGEPAFGKPRAGDPSNPQVIGSVDTPGYAQEAFVVDGKAYVADGGNGITIVPLAIEITPVIVNSINSISVTLSSPIMAGYYTLRIFNDSESDELIGTIIFSTEDDGLTSGNGVGTGCFIETLR